MADSLSLAVLVLLERLSPEPRAVLLLHDVFDHGRSQVAETIGKSQDNVRQLPTRARRHIEQGRRSRERQQWLAALPGRRPGGRPRRARGAARSRRRADR
jgi:DNA-directed RNA polymerase specialized sigma24 family protein